MGGLEEANLTGMPTGENPEQFSPSEILRLEKHKERAAQEANKSSSKRRFNFQETLLRVLSLTLHVNLSGHLTDIVCKVVGGIGSTENDSPHAISMVGHAVKIGIAYSGNFTTEQVGAVVSTLCKPNCAELAHVGILTLLQSLNQDKVLPHMVNLISLVGSEYATVSWKARDLVIHLTTSDDSEHPHTAARIAEHLDATHPHSRRAAASALGDLGSEVAARYLLKLVCMITKEFSFDRGRDSTHNFTAQFEKICAPADS